MNFSTLLLQGNGWLFIPSAILLGALHGLEPGHSKTMMAAFIVAIKGSVRQAVMLGLAATLSHTAIVWLIAVGGMYISQKFTAQAAEPWMLLVSGIIIVSTGFWMLWRTWSDARAWRKAASQSHDRTEQLVDTGHGLISLAIVEEGLHSRFQLRVLKGKPLKPAEVKLKLYQPESEQAVDYYFVERNGYLESASCVVKAPKLSTRLVIGHHDHTHDFDVHFHEHGHPAESVGKQEYQDAHERAHALDIQKRFTNRQVTNGQILLFGLTGGLIPCPAAVTVLLICLQLKALSLGATLVVSFSVGLALTLVSVGVIAAVGMQKATRKWNGLNEVARKAPYLSGLLISVVGLYMGLHGLSLLFS
ncbi:nickel/cobalt efflux protein RcnA [Dongshaea marina]|uniref:nickel/cobalt efflux protein RcnA n=1 Tax=Dongshaea marina TaxID=2047966 RepID=UPI000D3E4378|nr:nickel/cobalt efflux protein RcnA [Dongshaea marina]